MHKPWEGEGSAGSAQVSLHSRSKIRTPAALGVVQGCKFLLEFDNILFQLLIFRAKGSNLLIFFGLNNKRKLNCVAACLYAKHLKIATNNCQIFTSVSGALAANVALRLSTRTRRA